MSCQGCAAIIDCGPGQILDFAPSQGFYPVQGYTFVLDCPPGYFCLQPYWPRIINIPKGDIPTVTIGDGGNMCLLGCRSMLCINIPIGSSAAQVAALAAQLQKAWALEQANCINVNTGPSPGVPPPTLIPGGGGGQGSKVVVTNEEQCFTAHCVPESAGDPQSDCVEPGYYEQTLFNASPTQVAAVQAKMNSDALNLAMTTAQGKLLCGTCSQEQAGTIFCPGDPSKTSHLVIPQGAHCLAAGTPQYQADMLSQQDLTNGLAALQAGLGCPCIIKDITTFGFNVNCPMCWTLVSAISGHLIPPPNNFCGPFIGDWCQQYWNLTASCPGPTKFVPNSYTGPTFTIGCGGTPGSCH